MRCGGEGDLGSVKRWGVVAIRGMLVAGVEEEQGGMGRGEDNMHTTSIHRGHSCTKNADLLSVIRRSNSVGSRLRITPATSVYALTIASFSASSFGLTLHQQELSKRVIGEHARGFSKDARICRNLFEWKRSAKGIASAHHRPVRVCAVDVDGLPAVVLVEPLPVLALVPASGITVGEAHRKASQIAVILVERERTGELARNDSAPFDASDIKLWGWCTMRVHVGSRTGVHWLIPWTMWPAC